jgi:hypothetical protein
MSHKKYAISSLNVLVLVVCVLGFFLRIYFYVINRSLWFDEAMLALNLVNKSFMELLKPLENQVAPVGFLLFQKIVIYFLGNRDYILRIIPLLSGLLSIPLLYYTSKKYNSGAAPFVALGLFVLSTKLIYYSSELKQYSSDVLTTLMILLAAQKCLEDGAKKHIFVTFGIMASFAIWFSHPALFVIAGVLLTLGLFFITQRDLYRIFYVFGIGILFGISLLLLYFFSLQNLASNNALNNALFDYWKESFAPLLPWSNLHWYYGAFKNLLADPVGLPVSMITIGILALGIFSFAIKQRLQLLLILILPFPITLIASAMGKYPFSGRLLLFLIPLVLLLFAEGIEQIQVILLRINRPLTFLVIGALIIYFFYKPVWNAYTDLKSPPMGEDIKPIMNYIEQNKLGADQFYVYYGANPAFTYYAPFYGIGENDYVAGVSARSNPVRYLGDIEQFEGNQRVWFVFSHNCSWCIENEQNFILEHLDQIGLRKSEFMSEGATVYLYDLTQIP